LRLAVEFALLKILQRMQVVQRRQRFLVVKTGQEIAALDGLALASAALDDSTANQRRRT
jgi:hypothetical protein